MHHRDSLFTPADDGALRRSERLRELQLGGRPEPEFDEFAAVMATVAGAPLAMVNFIDEERQYFAGLYAPSLVAGALAAPDDPARTMTRDQGWCPHVVARRLPFVLEDVCDYPRFAGNPVVDQFGIRSYLGAPLIDWTGVAIGSVCVVDRMPRPWGDPGLDFIKAQAAAVIALIRQREDRAAGQG